MMHHRTDASLDQNPGQWCTRYTTESPGTPGTNGTRVYPGYKRYTCTRGIQVPTGTFQTII
eukprot:1674400-Rhodomonas_salina.2